MKIFKRFAALFAAVLGALFPLASGCAKLRAEDDIPAVRTEEDGLLAEVPGLPSPGTDVEDNTSNPQNRDGAENPENQDNPQNSENQGDSQNPGIGGGSAGGEECFTEEPPQKEPSALYVAACGQGINVRSGAGTGYSVLGQLQDGALYAFKQLSNGWYSVYYRGKTGYVSAKYLKLTSLPASRTSRTEAVISEGCKLLGAPYVYGATRFHDGGGRLLDGFDADKFDCSSLMQYIFHKGAGVLLGMTTRDQVLQGKAVNSSQLARGDLMFFTNASRKDKTGIERVGHVAMYLGGGYILHTSSDFAKIEKISAARWAYFITARRMVAE